ncbi:unnamed protein product [Symbiodinium natans]|uniref:Uncharacterized protein n=1 Tax=Symbiodinium natans TaxID=878477 RepID=A0A812LFI9_9DINO|nr:unnamed protein product [Symbiodinium natans]
MCRAQRVTPNMSGVGLRMHRKSLFECTREQEGILKTDNPGVNCDVSALSSAEFFALRAQQCAIAIPSRTLSSDMATQLWKFALATRPQKRAAAAGRRPRSDMHFLRARVVACCCHSSELLLEFVAVHGQSQTPETCEGETCEEGVFMQVRSMPASFLELSMAQIRSGARGAPVEQLKQQLRGMAMARVGAGSGDPNYTVWNISQANFSAVFASIKEDMEAIIDEIELSATRDNNQLELARGAVADCNTQLNRSVPQDVQDLGALHRACRVQEASDLAARDAAFQALTAHLQNPISVQDCLQDFGRGGCEVNDITSTEYVQRALECSEAIRDWAGTYHSQLDTLQSTYDSAVAAYADKTKECNVDQQEFEIGYCTLRTHLEDQCSEQHTCYDSAQSLFNSTRDLILQSNASRYVAYASARQVQCYIDVLSADNLTASAVDSCDQAQFDTSNLTLNIPELPAKMQCNIFDDDFPCSQEWIHYSYVNFPSGVHLAACAALRPSRR